MSFLDSPISDVLIIGGSHTGLSAALTLYRALHTCTIFDSLKPRNSYATPIRLTPTWEHQGLDKFKESAKKELLNAGYAKFVDAEVEKVENKPDGLFEVTDSTGVKWTGRKVLFATGSKDIFPGIPGYSELYASNM
jgi:thioredoxin reductase